MARTPIPPSATAVRKRSPSERRSRCAMLTFSCFLPLETGTSGVVLTARIAQRYKIFARSATPTIRASCQALAATCCAHGKPVSACGRRGAWRLYCCFVAGVLYARRSLIKIIGDRDVCGCKEWWKAVQGERGPGTGRRPPRGRRWRHRRAPCRLLGGRRGIRPCRKAGQDRDPGSPAGREDPRVQVQAEKGLQEEDRAQAGADPGKGAGGI